MTDSLEAIYAELPSIACKRKCYESCGPIAQCSRTGLIPGMPPAMSPAEARRLDFFEQIPDPNDALRCTLLDHRLLICRAYGMRPLVCRAFGVVDDPRMRCPFGCVPERWLSNEEFRALQRRAEAIR